MNLTPTPATIEGIYAFQSLDGIQRTALAKQLKIRRYSAGEPITTQSSDDREVYFILSGKIRVCAFSKYGKEIQFEDLNEGEMFGELAALDGQGRASDCISLAESSIAIMSQTDFLTAIDTHTGLNRYVMKRLIQMLRSHMGRVFEFSAHTVKDRLRFELFRIAIREGQENETDIHIQNPPTHADIAARISTHREAVTKELKRLETLKVITWKPGTHIVHDIHALTMEL